MSEAGNVLCLHVTFVAGVMENFKYIPKLCNTSDKEIVILFNIAWHAGVTVTNSTRRTYDRKIEHANPKVGQDRVSG